MAIYGLTDGWFGHDDGPLREIPSNSELARLFESSEAAVAASAWEAGAGLPKPQYADWVGGPRTTDADIFNAEHRGD
jgi:hypothetical protein